MQNAHQCATSLIGDALDALSAPMSVNVVKAWEAFAGSSGRLPLRAVRPAFPIDEPDTERARHES